MRLLLLADIHANLEGFEAVLSDAHNRGYDSIVFLGDVVGYGADAKATLDRLRALKPKYLVRGNHESMLLALASNGGKRTTDTPVQQSLQYQLAHLEPDDLAWLRSWRPGARHVENGVECYFVHGSPRNPDEYVDNLNVARDLFRTWSGKLTFVGHTHMAGVYAAVERDPGNVRFSPCVDPQTRLPLPPKGYWIANPGSVGQPRDGIPLGSYGIFDFEKKHLEVYRVDYDFTITQNKIRAAGLPDGLAARLAVGK